MNKIYVIVGECGEYSDRSEWCVKAFETEKSAQQEVIRMSKNARIIEKRCNIYYEGENKIDRWREDKFLPEVKEFIGDSKLDNLSHMGTLKYRYEEITLEI